MKLLAFSIGLITSILVLTFYLLCEDLLLPIPPTPKVPDIVWGPKVNEEIQEFRISVPKKVLEDLKSRIDLDLTRLSDPLEASNFEFGFNTDFLRTFAEYWVNEFDWDVQEKKLNSFLHFTTNIDGLDIHFLHAKPKEAKIAGRKVVPLLLVHGWPGSFVEFLDIIPILTAGDNNFAFEVIAPSIPGYGFSSKPAKQGFDLKQAAKIFKQLMVRLGHHQFYCQGGDWGSVITTYLTTLFPENVLGLHLNMHGVISPGGTLKNLLVAMIPGVRHLLVDSEDMEKVMNTSFVFTRFIRETGYMHLQATKPDTLGVGLSSSPLGLAAYIMEKFSTWTRPEWTTHWNGGMDETHPISKEKILTNVMIYWVTNTITSSMRFYKENLPLDNDINRIPAKLPVAFADFPSELYRTSKFLLTGKFPNLIQYTRMSSGGHFAAMEVPEILAKDIFKFVNKILKNEKLLKDEF